MFAARSFSFGFKNQICCRWRGSNDSKASKTPELKCDGFQSTAGHRHLHPHSDPRPPLVCAASLLATQPRLLNISSR